MLGKQRETTDIRRRKGKGKGEEHVEPLDEDDQAKMIDQLRAESVRQQESILTVFRYLCGVAAIVLILSTLYLDQWHLKSIIQQEDARRMVRPFSIGHGMTSSVLHLLSPNLTLSQKDPNKNKNNQNLLFNLALAADLLVASCMLWVARRYADSDETLLWMHYGILTSNVLVMLVAVLLRWDGESTEKALTDLSRAQYRYKSL